ncbi:hypothetical protein BDP27DRAFT_1534430 [Rhodocollybia butyracea]|uniref:Uncharacterized protein n=1 Tax=Rhodocollybia butyracea TaxID=206335 RepID=A0A9P5PKV4_9AGAR|nr:hypothetical protein BDP27DRAFT_1534430 [Rhodocollybia butyracea]
MSLPSQSPSNEDLAIIQSQLNFGYVIQMTAVVMIWDIVIHIADDVKLLFLLGRCRPPTIVYFLSRLMLGNRFFSLINSCIIIAVFTLFQFFIRVKVIYCEGSRLKTGIFLALWVFASGGASFTVYAVGQPCTNHDPTDTGYWIRMSLPVIAIFIYDSCVFLAISYRIYHLSLLFIAANPGQIVLLWVVIQRQKGTGEANPHAEIQGKGVDHCGKGTSILDSSNIARWPVLLFNKRNYWGRNT